MEHASSGRNHHSPQHLETGRPQDTDEYYPQRSDSRLELAPPPSSFLEFFKQSLIYTGTYCTDPLCCTFYEHNPGSNLSAGKGSAGEGLAIQEDVRKSVELDYPLALFEHLQDLPPLIEVHHLAGEFHRSFAPSVPFLSQVSCLSPHEKEVPVYLLLCEALLGAAASKEARFQQSTETLWRACVDLATGTVEVDNSLGRAIPWLTAVRITQ